MVPAPWSCAAALMTAAIEQARAVRPLEVELTRDVDLGSYRRELDSIYDDGEQVKGR